LNTLNIFRTAENRRTISAGEVLFSRGDAADVMYAVLDGRLDVTVNGALVDTVEAGGIVGELALVHGGEPRSATVSAAVDSVVVPVTEAEFLRHVHTTPFFALQLLRITADRLKRTNELI
jgi:CRP-like cAMP-binding protein